MRVWAGARGSPAAISSQYPSPWLKGKQTACRQEKQVVTVLFGAGARKSLSALLKTWNASVWVWKRSWHCLLPSLLLPGVRAEPEPCQAQNRGHAQSHLVYFFTFKARVSAAKAQRGGQGALSKRHCQGDEEFPREEHS